MGLFNFFGKSSTDRLFEAKGYKQSEVEVNKFQQYEKESRPIWNKYQKGMNKLQSDWSVMYNLKEYSGTRAKKYESDCLKNIELYKQLTVINKKYGEKSPPNVPAFKRLAMLYEKQGKFEESSSICIDALRNGVWGDGMQGRLARMIKKAGRTPNHEEMKLL